MLKRAHKGTYHKISKKHLNRYVKEFVVRHNIQELDTVHPMEIIVAGMINRRIIYKDLESGEGGGLNLCAEINRRHGSFTARQSGTGRPGSDFRGFQGDP